MSSSPSAINRSNYAAPNTPIASSKQPKKKLTTPSLASPIAKSRTEAGLAAAGRSIAEEQIPVIARRPSQTSDVMHAQTPSKNLFSPNLRFGADNPNPNATINEVDSEKEPLTPIKQSVDSQAQSPSTPIASAKLPTQAQQQTSTASASTTNEVRSPNAAAAAAASSSTYVNAPSTPSSVSNTQQQQQQQSSQVASSTSNTTTSQTTSHTTQAADDQDDDEDVFNPYLFIANLPPHTALSTKSRVCLPQQHASKSQLITLALDLDETLVHCSIEPIPNPDHIFPVSFNDVLYQVYVRKRPYLDHFLETIYKNFEMVVFTASQKVYADALLDLVDPEKKFVHHRLFREACVFVQGNYLKDLTVLGRDLSKTILVDNSPHTYGFHIDNGIPIESWFEDTEDTELLKLAEFLKRLIDNNISDVRPVIREHFKTYQLVNQARMGYPVVLSAPPF